MRANWFIALPVPPDGWFDAIPPPPAGIRAFAPTDLHLTVAFLGGVSEAAARAAWAATLWTDGPRSVSLAELVPMGAPRRYSALSFLLADGRREIEAEISRSRGAAYAAAGTAPDERPAKAHVTIARPMRRATESERASALEWAKAIPRPGVSPRLARVALYTWADDRASSLFRVVEERAL